MLTLLCMPPPPCARGAWRMGRSGILFAEWQPQAVNVDLALDDAVAQGPHVVAMAAELDVKRPRPRPKPAVSTTIGRR